MTDLAAIREHIESLAVQAKGYRPTGIDDGLNIIRLIALCDAIDELAALLLADTPSVEPAGLAEALRALSADDPLALSGGDMSYAETLAARLWHAADHDCTIDGAAIRAALLPTQASDSPEKTT